MSTASVSKRRFEPVERCIYCGSTNPPLSDEHTVADGLGGRLVLPKASCETCRVMTGKFEQRVLRDMMWGLRLAYGTRGSKRKPPDKIRVAIPNTEDETVSYTEMRHEDVAAKAVLPVFARMPAIVDGRGAGPVDPDEEQSWMLLMDNAAGERMRQEGHAGVSMFVDVFAFVRTLAKTAHAQTVGRYGLDAFDPCLLDIICGRARDWPRFIGADIPFIGAPEHAFETWLQLAVHAPSRLIIARMQFFASQDTPIYTAISGRLRDNYSV